MKFASLILLVWGVILGVLGIIFNNEFWLIYAQVWIVGSIIINTRK